MSESRKKVTNAVLGELLSLRHAQLIILRKETNAQQFYFGPALREKNAGLLNHSESAEKFLSFSLQIGFSKAAVVKIDMPPIRRRNREEKSKM